MENLIPHSPTTADLRALFEQTQDLRLSIYLKLPEHRGFDRVRGFPAKYEQAVKTAAARMSLLGASEQQTEQALSQLGQVDVSIVSLPSATRSLAVFWGPSGVTACALAHQTTSQTHIGRSFRIRPFLQALRLELSYRVLAVSSNQVHLYEGDAHGLRALTAKDVPASLEEALGVQLSDGHSQFHSGGGSAVVHHGQGGASDDRSLDQERFHHKLARSVAEFWNGREDPVVLATDPSNTGSLRKVLRLAGLLEQTAVGNPDRLSPHELHERTWPIMEQWRAQQQEQAIQSSASGSILEDLDSVLQAAIDGRIAHLWVDANQQVAGHLNLISRAVDSAIGDEDVLDELTALVTSKGGSVACCEEGSLPTTSQVMAVLR